MQPRAINDRVQPSRALAKALRSMKSFSLCVGHPEMNIGCGRVKV